MRDSSIIWLFSIRFLLINTATLLCQSDWNCLLAEVAGSQDKSEAAAFVQRKRLGDLEFENQLAMALQVQTSSLLFCPAGESRNIVRAAILCA